jgi:hypothetical protein
VQLLGGATCRANQRIKGPPFVALHVFFLKKSLDLPSYISAEPMGFLDVPFTDDDGTLHRLSECEGELSTYQYASYGALAITVVNLFVVKSLAPRPNTPASEILGKLEFLACYLTGAATLKIVMGVILLTVLYPKHCDIVGVGFIYPYVVIVLGLVCWAVRAAKVRATAKKIQALLAGDVLSQGQTEQSTTAAASEPFLPAVPVAEEFAPMAQKAEPDDQV